MAKPACMNMTRNPQIRVQTKLMATLFWPIWLPASARVTPALASLTVTSAMVPVMIPPGSPFSRSAAAGALAAASRSSAVAGAAGGAGGAAAAGCAGVAGACAHAIPPTVSPAARMERARRWFRRSVFIASAPSRPRRRNPSPQSRFPPPARRPAHTSARASSRTPSC